MATIVTIGTYSTIRSNRRERINNNSKKDRSLNDRF